MVRFHLFFIIHKLFSDSSGESSSNPILYASNHNTSSPTFSSVLPCWSTSIFNHLTSRPPHSPPMSQSKLRSQDPSPLLSAGPNGGQRADLSTNPINGQSNSVQPNQNTDPTDLTGQPERLPGRRLRLLKFQGIFLLCFTMAVFLGMAFHHSKVRSIRPSLSIEGFESFLPISSGPLPRHINLGALIAVDLLMHGWGNSMTGPIRTSQNVSHHLMVPSGCDALMGTSFCGIYENLIDRSSCLSDRSESNALNCSIAYGLSLMNMAAPYQQFAALVLSWRQITPIVPPSCHFLLSLENHNTMKLQNDVIQLAFQHPKLQSLQQYFESPNYIIGPSSVNETHQRLLQTLNGVKLFSIGSSAPTGLMDNSIWFAQNAPLKNWFHLKSSTDLQCSISPSEAKEFPLESLRHSQICWEVDVGPFGSLGHPVKRQTEGTDSMSKAGEKWMLLLFRWSKGIVSPCYPFYPFLKWLLTSGAVYVAVVICWLHSLASPSPVTLVHFPRLVIYQFIMLYRVVVLYILGGFLETLTGPGFDFSDHIVLYMMLGLILCIECTAAERSHERIPVIVSKESYRRQFLGQEGPTEQKETIVGKSSSRLSKCSTGVANFVKLCLSSDSEDDDIRQPSNSLEQIGWKWPYIVKYVHCYSFVFLGVLCYSAHFTSLFFHHPYESFMGLLVGLLGLYLPFWILISCGCLPLDRFGILRGGRCGRMN